MRPYQNYLVVLARRPDAYGYLKTLHSVKPPLDEMYVGGIVSDYIVTLNGPSQSIPLPSGPLMWTAISYLIWDDFDASDLTADQQSAMLDWLHWGGQLLISGPNSLDALQSGFLSAWLPARPGPTRPLQLADVELLNGNGPGDRSTCSSLARRHLPEVLQLKLQEGAEFVAGAGQLVAERRVGRGRIVTTAFSLSTREFVNWEAGFDNFFNGCLLRRPPRRYQYSDQTGLTVTWGEGLRDLPMSPTPAEPESEFSFDGRPQRQPAETLLTSRLRYFSRDARHTSGTEAERPRPPDVGGYGYDRLGGVAGWNDFSDCSRAAHMGLTGAAGIEVPDRTFVFWTLGLYLLVLVPANWAVFRALGRVEWAWLAVPVIAVAGTWFVVRMAQLDIGFARSRSEIAVLETQPGYRRAHLTRYIGLYTSLSTRYALSFAQDVALALPLATTRDESRRRRESPQTVTLRRVDRPGEKLRLEDFAVNSASTEMIHSEEMLDLKGTIRLTEPAVGLYRVVNESAYAFRDVGLVRRRGGQVQLGWIGRLAAQASATVQFRTVTTEQPLWQSWLAASQDQTNGSDRLAPPPLLQLALDPGRLQEGDVRLVGWHDEEIAGVEIRPGASQQSFRTLLVANLQYGPLPAPESDQNAVADVMGRTARMIELIDFGKDYGDFTAVECLNLKIEAGEMFGFIGPNGAGKSTTIRFLATLLKASRGEGHRQRLQRDRPIRWRSAAASGTCPTRSACTTA